ncbi:unnamed protein product [Pleuronectes platessa]|uniref:Uncharacterized protein n=1 Tax=Pleuronectes platessa TaxID=8262 RepID=A0A9N7YEZ5_PLEPL|nr:unnamed protein product [Pleuronectes platessa]
MALTCKVVFLPAGVSMVPGNQALKENLDQEAHLGQQDFQENPDWGSQASMGNPALRGLLAFQELVSLDFQVFQERLGQLEWQALLVRLALVANQVLEVFQGNLAFLAQLVSL